MLHNYWVDPGDWGGGGEQGRKKIVLSLPVEGHLHFYGPFAKDVRDGNVINRVSSRAVETLRKMLNINAAEEGRIHYTSFSARTIYRVRQQKPDAQNFNRKNI